MRLRSGTNLVEVVHRKNTSLPQNEIPNTEQSVRLIVGATGSSNLTGTNELILTPIVSATSLLGVVVSLSGKTSIPTNPRATHATIGDPRPSYVPGFTIPPISRDFFYGMPIAAMEGLQSNASMYAYNNITIKSPLNPYVVLGSAMSNLVE